MHPVQGCPRLVVTLTLAHMLKGLDPDIRAAALSHWEPLTAERTIFFDLGNGLQQLPQDTILSRMLDSC